MKIFDSFGSTVSEGAKVVSEKTKKATGVASIKTQINSTKSGLTKLYKDLGKAYYENPEDAEVLTDIVNEINNVNDKVAILEKKLAAKQGKIKCEACGEYMSADYAYCPKCGVQVEQVEDVKETLADKLEAAGEKIKEAVKDADLKDKLETAGEKVKTFAEEKELKEKLANAGEKVKTFAEEKELKEKLANAGEKVKNFAEEKELKEKFGSAAKGLGEKFGTALNGAKEFINKKTNPEDIYDMEDVVDEPSVNCDATTVDDVVDTAVESAETVVENAAEEVKETVVDPVSEVKDVVEETTENKTE